MKQRIFFSLVMLLCSIIAYPATENFYAKVTATDGSIQWLKIEAEWNNKNSCYDIKGDWTKRDINGALDLDEVYTESGGTGTKKTITEVSSGAFFHFSGLTSVKGSSVKILRNQAFDYCSSLTSINFPNLQTIDDSAFGNCISLVSYTVPANVTNINGAAFSGCTSLTNLTVNSNNNRFSCANSILYDKNKTVLYAFLSSRTDVAFVVPSTVKTIGIKAFASNKYLKSVILPNGVETIKSSAFSNAVIQSIYIPQSVTKIESWAFINCSSLEKVKIANPTPINLTSSIFDNSTPTLYVPQGSKDVYEAANYWNDAAEIKEYVPSPIISFVDAAVKNVCIANWDYDGDGELSEEEALEIRDIGTLFQGNTEITSFNELQYFTNLCYLATSAFSGCTNLATFTVPSSLTKIGYNAFQNTAWLNAQPDGLVYIDNVLYVYKGIMPANSKIVVKEGTTCICDYAFNNKTSLTEVELPGSLLYIGDTEGYVFSGCTGLTAITIPVGVKDIVRYAFSGSGLKSIELPEGLESIGNSSFRSCTFLESIIIPDKVRTIGKNTFRSCSRLQSVTMPSSLTSVATDAFRDCNQLQRVDISNLGGWCNVSFEDARANPLCFAHHLYLNGKEVFDIETDPNCLLAFFSPFSNTWTLAYYTWDTIKPYVFYGCQSLKTVSLAKEITSVGSNAFYGCNSLKSVKTETKPFGLNTSAFPTRANVSLYTTQSNLNQYQEADVWNEFKAVKSYPDLDVNEDAEVDVLDVVDIVRYTKGATSEAFVHFLADFNNDNKIAAYDANWVSQCIPTTKRFTTLPVSEGVADIVFADNIQICTGENNTTSILLQNTTEGLVGFQMDITLPDGISLIEKECTLSNRIADAEQQLQIGKVNESTYRLTATSQALLPLTENDGELINISLKATELADGGTVDIKNIRLVTDNSERLVLADADFNIQIIDVTPAITFQDESAKSFCVSNWDTNGDGELSTREAAKVTDIGTLFRDNRTITSFYELKHFIGLTAINEEAFLGCTNLQFISIPENVETIGDKAFYGCNSLKGVYTYMQTPPAITETTFTNYVTANLYVCRGRNTVYQNAPVWMNFNMISVMMFKEGMGTEENPYLLFDADDFENLASDVNGGTTYEGTFFKVAKKEIDFIGVSHRAIGTNESKYFSGNFDGNNAKLMNMTSNKALFGYIGKKGVVANIMIDESCKISGYSSNVAGFAGSNEGIIDNCINKAPISSTWYHVGGICGDNMGIISNCKNYGTITGESNLSTDVPMIGGIAGDLDQGKIINCENYGAVSSPGFQIGGIVGLVTDYTCTIENCVNRGDVTGAWCVGGIIGDLGISNNRVVYINNNLVSECTITATDGSSSSSYNVGAISDGMHTSATNNFYTPDVIVKAGNTIYDGITPRGVWVYDTSSSGYMPNDVTENCAAMILQKGDATRDGVVNVTDILAVANYILKIPMPNFNVQAADVTGDGKINVTDIMGIANIILKVNTSSNARKVESQPKLDPQ